MRKTIYFGGDILTMAEDALYVDAILVQDGRIQELGQAEALKRTHPEAALFDLQGHTLMPAFLDPHSHITALASTMGLASLEDAGSFDEIVDRLLAFKRERGLSDSDWLIGFGYDHNLLREKAHPTRQVLDRAGGNPVLISNTSGHMGVVSTAGLEALGITEASQDPAGGKIGREQGSRRPNGYLEETAFTSTSARLPQPSPEQLCRQLQQAEQVYLKNGITTIQDGYTRPGEWAMLEEMARQGRFTADVVCYPDVEHNRAIAQKHPEFVGRYHNRLKIGGYKAFLDGSPQGRTAWLSQPYENAEDGYRGYPTHTDAQVRSYVQTARQDRMQLITHCNGDAAAQQLIEAFEQEQKAGGDLPSLRPVMIHAQTVRPDQLARMAPLSMIASFFVAHTYFWGDVHLQNLGRARAMAISPARSAQAAGVVYTFHQDTPVVPPDMLKTVWCAANRLSRAGVALGGARAPFSLRRLKGGDCERRLSIL